MEFPIVRPRRLRVSDAMRRLVRETDLLPRDLIYPLFVTNGKNVKKPIASMPGVYQMSVDNVLKEGEECLKLGIPGVILFGIPAYKDEKGSSGYDPDEAVQKACAALKKEFPTLIVITDVCLCEYTSHGHCGLIEDGDVLNDPTLDLLARTALSHARAGADIVAPSDMMDGRVGAIRSALDGHGFEKIPVMSYAVKYASAFYGPFRDAAGSTPQFGDRRSYQMDPGNVREALKEIEQDLAEGADMLMVKPALSYMDVIRAVKEVTNVPVAAYNVSGEYSMIKAAAQNDWVDEKRVTLEMLLSMKRAGADMILTYFAKDAAAWLKEDM
ncbi:porphobilinogen synthase [Dethiobacter alkaliphilus]|uniref:Delta-aminolevulinic acid dehydratase n=1 Tax=Dethiobacter alkaliphilus AHT 1 TaxID=555088 RepID=C0GG53_DETAL|nr:porphobilinogen synthase [Dethiobacter alkaliphilus]EEG77742.1 Porphobilinogen synthase [Dethiobacter alkaliphilus AHT 1]MCW3491143.1 porphobilinogen synthase [Dethiobacter alkaliphilus]